MHPIVLVDQPDQVQSRARATHNAYLNEWQEAALRGDSFPAQQALLLPYPDLLSALKRHAVLLLSDLSRGLGQFQPTDALEFPSEPVMPYDGRLEPLKKDISAWQAQGCAVALLTGGEARGQRLLRALAQQGVAASYAETAGRRIASRRGAAAADFRAQGLPEHPRRAVRGIRQRSVRLGLPAQPEAARRGRAHRVVYRSEDGRLRGARVPRHRHLRRRGAS